MREHRYRVTVTWTGNRGTGTSGYRDYARAHGIASPEHAGKPLIPGSSDPVFRGDGDRWSPEELLLAALSACHKLWYLHLCADAGVVVTGYVDHAEGIMIETADGGGRFTRVTLHPEVTVAAAADHALAERLHAEAHAKCFVANSVNFPVEHVPTIRVAG